MDIKNNLVPNQFAVKYPHCISDIPARHRNNYSIFLDADVWFVAIGSFFMLHNTRAAIEALIIGFLLSPYGIPMIGAVIIAFIQGINEAIKSI